ncbi:hypothetical protein CES85_2704 [Ochrobactrum quorumnocens]|uniref:Uncharacterized protein n=1 Tax=Ochrobactrum quorumnocens TaxID=271865 RepID=A0A248UF74_9HYPH|nr:hypothetical protein CES85_2704 [[Ochrobactrum] quorumnocens]
MCHMAASLVFERISSSLSDDLISPRFFLPLRYIVYAVDRKF